MRRAGLLFTSFVALLVLIAPLSALAHPLGNFTTNQYVGVHVEGGGLTVDYVLDLAEIPAAQQRRAMDADGDDTIDDAEAEAYAAEQCRRTSEELGIFLDGSRLPVAVEATHLAFPEGEAGLVTLRLECRLAGGPLPSEEFDLAVENDLFAERLGWREMVLTTVGFEATTDLPSTSSTARLTSYPDDLLSSPIDVRSGTATLSPGPDSALGSPPPPPGAELPAQRVTPVDALASLIDPSAGSPALPIAMLVAVGLGILHALAPGHGKTVMAAYLVGSKGSLRQAMILGVAVAVSHTAGVLGLGLVTLVGTAAFAPEQVFPVLSMLSGLIVVGIGVWMFVRWLGTRRKQGHDHHHPHSPGTDLHSHGGIRHSHAIPEEWAEGSGWKLLASMGLAGGLVPSTSAVVLLLAAVNLGRIPFGILLIVLFGVGMATTLVGVGLGMVGASRFGLDRLSGHSWIEKMRELLTPVAAVVVIVVGTALTVNAL